ncbi:hypothetical protein [Wenjunlia tyrosinilytica]|uniref:Sensor domain-containing protein n=1 Tax=Wenjunlia tyrosinilytica TaxID=1544741 RepID=A0A918DYZ5_9ACTN|nr:hypothetical protein [Wenjunlia tyrosinilytica]GGO89871.1 hypothetical protein GCM10012280_34080 [Wenjunlia tyrosinilytica]
MRFASRPIVISAALVPVMALGLTACGGDDDSKAEGKGKGRSKGSASAPASSGGKAAAALTKAQLTAAALTAQDLPAGYKVVKPKGADDLFGTTATATPSRCQPLQDMGAGKDSVRPTAVVDQNYPQSAKPSALLFSRIAAYSGGNAQKAMADLKDAAESCPSYTSKDTSDGTVSTVKVTTEKAPALGDESVLLNMTTTSDGETFTVRTIHTRVGSTLSMFLTFDIRSTNRAELPRKILAKQADKLKAAAGR